MANSSETQSWIYTTLSAMIDRPQDLTIKASNTSLLTIEFTITCDLKDAGKIIGKNGHNIRAFRTLLLAMGRKGGYTYHLILEKPAEAIPDRTQQLSQYLDRAIR